MNDYLWTQEQFYEMSWHDNHVHAFRIEEGAHGSGMLILDLDYILDWISNAKGYQFRIIPVTLKFFEVSDLRVSLDYASPTAALGPFSIHDIERKYVQRERYTAQIWTIAINWPAGEISFESSGFEQHGQGCSVISDGQYLSPDERKEIEQKNRDRG